LYYSFIIERLLFLAIHVKLLICVYDGRPIYFLHAVMNQIVVHLKSH